MVWNRFVVLGFGCVLLTGCFGGDGNERPTAPVKVSVTYKSKPVSGATVQFLSAENPQPAVGMTDASGNCSLTTYKTNDGAIVGNNLVTISKVEIDASKVKPVRDEDKDLVGVTPPPTLKSMIPEKYSAPGSSGLTEMVKKGQNVFSYELKD